MDDHLMRFDAQRSSSLSLGEETKGAAQKPDDRAAATPLRRRRILVVDDNVDAADSLVECLRLCGHEVRAATDGTAAVQEALAFRPEVVLLDIGMPAMDGFAVAERLRAEPALRSSVLIALTGFVQERDVTRSREAGFDHHLAKPLDFKNLLSLIDA